MSTYTWGIDGYGHAHICRSNNNIVIFCMIDGGGQMGVWLLESQDIDNLIEEL